MEQEVDFELSGYGENTTRGRARFVLYDRRARVRRGVTGLLMWWGAAVAGFFIPVAHFLLVPGFVAFGLYVFFARLRAGSSTLWLKGVCPDCNIEQSFDADGEWSLPRRISCTSCGRSLTAQAR